MTQGLRWLLILSCAVHLSVLAGPLDPVKSLIQGFYTAYSGQDFTAPNCLNVTMQNDLLVTLEALALDIEEEHSFPMFFSHVSELTSDLVVLQASCGLTSLNDHLLAFVGQEGLASLLTTLAQDREVLEGFALQLMQQVLVHDWQAAGITMGLAVATVIPPEINTRVTAPIPNANFFQKVDNFTAGLFYGFIVNPNPKKQPTCLTTYNQTAKFFYNATNTIKGCVHLFIPDCAAIRSLIPAAIINIQGTVLACKLQDLLQIFKNLGDPTYWSQVAVAYYFNTQNINARITDIKQSVMLQNWYAVGVDVGTIVRLIFNFKIS